MRVATHSAIELAPAYDAIVVGSGYGGGVAASRLARMGFKVAVLEQGRNWQPGEFPTTAREQRKLTRISGRAPTFGDPSGLYRLTVGKGLTVFASTGLGGGSLINAGVALRPDLSRLRNEGWPSAVVGDGLLQKGLARAETMLGVSPAPDPERFAKFRGMCELAQAAGRPLQRPSITIAHKAGVNAAGVMQSACENCGDCWSGCNAGSKTTIGITYIADAIQNGAEVFCESRVESISKGQDQWQVAVKDLSARGETRNVTARILVLAAGTLGTVELLLRAQRRGLALSHLLGEKFSANGDDLAFGIGLGKPVHAVATGFPSKARTSLSAVGPHSMAYVDLTDESGPLCLHEGTMLKMMAAISPYKELFSLNIGRALRLFMGGMYGDEQSRTQIFYIVGHDDARGRLRLHKDNVFVDWPDYSSVPARVAAEKKVKSLIERMGGTFRPNPFALTAFGGNRIIAHPLGGCPMGETAHDGVVAPDGRVFDPSNGARGIHEGLYVCDGAAIPSSVGVSPLLTITALAERAMMLAAERLGRRLDVGTIGAERTRRAVA